MLNSPGIINMNAYRNPWVGCTAVLLAMAACGYSQAPTGKELLSKPSGTEAAKPFDAKQNNQPQDEDLFASNPSAASEVSTAFNPHMIGDFTGSFVLQMIVLNPGLDQRPITQTIAVPVGARGAFKLGENESPRPVDRVFGFHRNYNNVRGPLAGSPQFDLADSVVGFEKTFWGGDASFEMRVPYYNLNGDPGSSGVGDLCVLVKFALYNNRQTGDVFSTGLMVTLPTGEVPESLFGDVHATLYQPFIGYIYNMDRLFLQGFTSVVLPSDSRDIKLLFNDVGLGYQLYRAPGRFISAIVPAVEAHITTPLGSSSTIIAPEFVVLTAGIHVQLSGRATLSLAGAKPVSGDRIYDTETMVQFNYSF